MGAYRTSPTRVSAPKPEGKLKHPAQSEKCLALDLNPTSLPVWAINDRISATSRVSAAPCPWTQIRTQDPKSRIREDPRNISGEAVKSKGQEPF